MYKTIGASFWLIFLAIYPAINKADTYNDNLRTCLNGYASSCKHGELNEQDIQLVKKAEYESHKPNDQQNSTYIYGESCA